MSFKKNRKKYHNKNNSNNYNNNNNNKKEVFHKVYKPDPEVVAANEEAIRVYKENVRNCEYCSKPINDLTSAFVDKKTGGSIHFDCVLTHLQEIEKLEANQKISYIGQGKLAVIEFENPHDLRKFTIVRTIEWEEHESESEWRDPIADLYSKVR